MDIEISFYIAKMTSFWRNYKSILGSKRRLSLAIPREMSMNPLKLILSKQANNDKKFKKSENVQKKFFGKYINCGKKGHRQSDFMYKKETNVNNANVVEDQHEEICV